MIWDHNKKVGAWRAKIERLIVSSFNIMSRHPAMTYLIGYDFKTKLYVETNALVPEWRMKSENDRLQLYYDLANLDEQFHFQVLAIIHCTESAIQFNDTEPQFVYFINYQDKLKYKRDIYKITKHPDHSRTMAYDAELSARTYGDEDVNFSTAFVLHRSTN